MCCIRSATGKQSEEGIDEMTPWHFQFEKTLQASAVLLSQDNDTMSYLRLLKLLYIAEREILAETGRPLTGDHAVAMKNGPVLSRTFDTIKGQSSDADRWSEFIHRDGYKVVLRNKPGRGKLSKREIAKLEAVSQRYRPMEDFELSEATHEFEEWKSQYVPGTANPIPWQEILNAQNQPGMIAVAEHEAAVESALDSLLGS